MATTFYTGVEGSIKYGVAPAEVVSMSNWSITLANAIQTSAHFGDDWDTSKGGIMSGSVTLAGDLNIEIASKQLEILTALVAGTENACEFYPTGTKKISGNVVWSSVEISDPIEGKVTINIQGKFSGTVSVFAVV